MAGNEEPVERDTTAQREMGLGPMTLRPRSLHISCKLICKDVLQNSALFLRFLLLQIEPNTSKGNLLLGNRKDVLYIYKWDSNNELRCDCNRAKSAVDGSRSVALWFSDS